MKPFSLKAKMLLGFELLAAVAVLALIFSPSHLKSDIILKSDRGGGVGLGAGTATQSLRVIALPAAGPQAKPSSAEQKPKTESSDAIYQAKVWTPDWKKAPEFLQEFFALDRKAIRSARDEQTYQRLLSDRTLIVSAQGLLTDTPAADGADSEQTRDQRIFAVDYLVSALEAPANPAHAQIVKSYQSILASDPHMEARSAAAQKNVIGDRLDLYRALAHADRGALGHLVFQFKDDSSENIYVYAMKTLTAEDREKYDAAQTAISKR